MESESSEDDIMKMNKCMESESSSEDDIIKMNKYMDSESRSKDDIVKMNKYMDSESLSGDDPMKMNNYMDSESSSEDDPMKMNNYMVSESSSIDDLTAEQSNNPSFFQLYLPENNSKKLRIPPPFLKNFRGGIPQKISLKNSSGKVWSAKLGYIGNDLHITHGWDRYVKDHNLESGEFVMFRYQQNSTFLVMVYGADKLLKFEPRKKLNCRRSGGKGDGDGGGKATNVHFTDAGSIKFYKTFKAKFKNLVGVPLPVIEACLVIKLPQTVKLTNDTGKGIDIPLRKATDRYILGYAGLAGFWRKNGVREGHKLEFEVIRGEGGEIEQIIMRNITKSNFLGRGY